MLVMLQQNDDEWLVRSRALLWEDVDVVKDFSVYDPALFLGLFTDPMVARVLLLQKKEYHFSKAKCSSHRLSYFIPGYWTLGTIIPWHGNL